MSAFSYNTYANLRKRGKLIGIPIPSDWPIPLKNRCVWSLLRVKSCVVAKRRPAGVVWKFEEGLPAQVSFERGSKLRGPSRNSLRIASKWNVNTTKLN
ncbi:hypothetical protein AVEN_52277-1 [Araneus ventricosus]|uniref:Uncharacterized protein n=1 Tax=Araneus ventricosus TaxID=182803 RepID=A0A4Y2LL95_ARAVE|nr:hypothetical protein AVEN_52277-1 [Araneus ventricosus]